MRCIACDKNLTDYESTIKDASGRYMDMCKGCLRWVRDSVDVVGGNPEVSDIELDSDELPWYNNSTENEEEL